MKKQIAGLLTGLLVCSAFLTGCGKNEATEAVKESVEDDLIHNLIPESSYQRSQDLFLIYSFKSSSTSSSRSTFMIMLLAPL